MQKEHVDKHAGANHTDGSAKDTGKQARNDVAVVVIFAGTLSCPDLAGESCEKGPKDYRRSS